MEQEWLVYVDAGLVSWRRPEDKAGNVITGLKRGRLTRLTSTSELEASLRTAIRLGRCLTLFRQPT